VTRASIELQIGYLKRLPEEFAGERHVVEVGRAADGTYRWEERRGAPPAHEDSPSSIIRLVLVRAKDGRPDYSWRGWGSMKAVASSGDGSTALAEIRSNPSRETSFRYCRGF
jgi:hypothetical protein